MENKNEKLFSKNEIDDMIEKSYRYYRRNRNCLHPNFMTGVEYITNKLRKLKKQ